MRHLFVVILVFCAPLSPGLLWQRFSKELFEDYCYMLSACLCNPDVCENVAKNQALSHLQHLLQQHGKRLVDFCGMLEVDKSVLFLEGHNLLAKETMYNASQQSSMAVGMERTLKCGQRDAYNCVMLAIERAEGSVFFLDGPGGTGKTYLYNALLC